MVIKFTYAFKIKLLKLAINLLSIVNERRKKHLLKVNDFENVELSLQT